MTYANQILLRNPRTDATLAVGVTADPTEPGSWIVRATAWWAALRELGALGPKDLEVAQLPSEDTCAVRIQTRRVRHYDSSGNYLGTRPVEYQLWPTEAPAPDLATNTGAVA